MNWSALLLILIFGGVAFVFYQALAQPSRLEQLEGPCGGEGSYYLALLCLLGSAPASVVWTFTTIDDRSPLFLVLTIWMAAYLAWGLLGMFLPFPTLKWFVPPAYRTESEHIYPRPVIGLKRVKTLDAGSVAD